MKHSIPLSRPNISQAEIDAVTAVLRTPELCFGPKLGEFERSFASFCGTQHAVACSSGTAALHVLIRASGVAAGDEVITTPFSFVASANCALMERATPVFVDINAHTWNIRPELIEAAVTPRTKAIIPVHVFGQVAEMDPILEIAGARKLVVLEDACEALGSRYRGRHAGSLGHAGCFGFYPNKQITSGEGGMIVTNDAAIARMARSLRNQGRDGEGGWLSHQRLGYNYRLSDINCALGLAQLGRFAEIKAARDRVHAQYRDRLSDDSRIALQSVDPDVSISWFVFVVRLDNRYAQADRDRILSQLADRGIGCSNYFTPIHLQPYFVEQFGYKQGDFPACEALAARTIALPFHHELTERDVDIVCDELRKFL